MKPPSPDEEAYRFFSTTSANVEIRLGSSAAGVTEIQFLGNRAGLLSLANVFLWLVANAWRRELISLTALPFIHAEGSFSIFLRMTAEERVGNAGLLRIAPDGNEFEWVISEDDLQRVALTIHRLVSLPGHEYDRLEMARDSAAGICIRMTDAAEWIQRGHV